MKTSRSFRKYCYIGPISYITDGASKPGRAGRPLLSATLIVWLGLLFATFAYCENRLPFTLDTVSGLLKGGVSSPRIVQLIKENGVGFKLDEKSLKRLKNEGASNDIIVAIRGSTSPKPPSPVTNSPTPPPKDPRCIKILNRVQLGEALTVDDRKFLEDKC